MPRLSIVIPALGRHDLLEAGLVSVLEHRPVDSEVLVVLNEPYDDPYDLEGEIDFVQAGTTAGLLECLNLGFQSSAGSAIHFLGCGFEVCSGWADGPLARLADANVGAVVPLLVQPGPTKNRVAAGLGYHHSGRTELREVIASVQPPAEIEPVGPVGLAGFYSAAALEALDEVFSPAVGIEWSDVDLALRLRSAGFRVQLDSTSRIIGDPRAFTSTPAGLQRARFAERLYWRHAASFGRARSLVSHVRLVIGEALQGFPRSESFSHLVGRMLGCLDSLGPRSRVPAPRMRAEQTAAEPHRVDSSHELPGPSANASSPALGRKSQARA